jgi:small subunit ribosomal protein S16
VVQDSRKSPTSGKYIALLGSYDPHTKQASLDKEKAAHFLKHGAQPSERVVQLLKAEKVSLPKWVKKPAKHKREIRNPEKLRRNRPAEEKPAESPVEEAAADSAPAETETAPKTEQSEEAQPAEETPAEAEPQQSEQAKETEEKPAEEAEAKPEAESA